MHFKNGLFQKIDTKCLVRESESAHTRLDAEDVVVGREHVHRGRAVEGVGSDRNLRVVDARRSCRYQWAGAPRA